MKKYKSGKIKRHKFRKAIGLKQGFGKPYSAHSIPFRVEFSWENPDGSEENFQTHWIECRKFFGEEKSFLEAHYSQHKEEWSDRETLESKFVAVYCAGWLVKQRQKAEGRWQKFYQDQGYSQAEIPSLNDLSWQTNEELRRSLLGQSCSTTPAQFLDFPSALCPLPSAFFFNQCFIFPTTKIDNETIRMPIYQIKWSENLAKNSIFGTNLAIVFNNAIYHRKAN